MRRIKKESEPAMRSTLCEHIVGAGSAFPAGLHEFEAFGCQMFFGGEHLPPDAGGCGQVGQSQAEGFDGEPAVVVDFFECSEGFVPVDAPSPGVERSFSEMCTWTI